MRKVIKIDKTIQIIFEENLAKLIEKIKEVFEDQVGDFKEEYLESCDIICDEGVAEVNIFGKFANPNYKNPRPDLEEGFKISKTHPQKCSIVDKIAACDSGELTRSKNFEEFARFVSTSEKHKEIRYGQNVMNLLSEFDEGAYSAIHNTQADCFYDCLKAPLFWEKLAEYYDNNTE